MILRYRDTNGRYKIVTAEYIEVEGALSGEIHNKKWIFKGDKDETN